MQIRIGILTMVLGSFFVIAGSGLVAAASILPPSPTGILIPLYTYPTDQSWNQVIQTHLSYPSTPIIAIINPASGVGSFQNNDYVNGIRTLQANGITVLGYDYTDYARKSISAVETEALNYKTWYNVNGIFFDGMSSIAGNEGYYSSLNAYAKNTLGLSITIGDPGVAVPTSFIGIFDTVVIYEGVGYPPLSLLSQYSSYSKSNFAFIAFNTFYLDTKFLNSFSSYVQYLYVTNLNFPNPYNALPQYFQSEVPLVNNFQQQITTAVSTTSTTTSSSIATSTTVPSITTTTTQTVTSTVTSPSTTTVTSTVTPPTTTTTVTQTPTTVTSTTTVVTFTYITKTLTTSSTISSTTTTTQQGTGQQMTQFSPSPAFYFGLGLTLLGGFISYGEGKRFEE